MKSYIGITDFNWYSQVSSNNAIDEVNFWQPGGSRQFRALEEGDLFLFKLHSPRNYIVGGGLFKHSSLLPISLAWKAFGLANGVRSLDEMRERTQKYRRIEERGDYTVGCILLCEPFFLPQDLWVPVPTDWKPNIVQGRTYDLSSEPGSTMLQQLQVALGSIGMREQVPERNRYGTEIMVKPRLGQGGFRVLVTDAYGRRCSVSGERVLPVLEAAHVRPYAKGGEHSIANGLLLRSDLHILFDQGYLTVTPDRALEVSSKIRDQFENGKDYYAFHGQKLRLPCNPEQFVSKKNLEWHNQEIYLG